MTDTGEFVNVSVDTQAQLVIEVGKKDRSLFVDAVNETGKNIWLQVLARMVAQATARAEQWVTLLDTL